MPRGGYYFDQIVRQPPLEESRLDPQDNCEEVTAVGEEVVQHYAQEAKRLETTTDKALFAGFCFSSFGDIALVPAPWLKHPRGIRDIEEWYVSTLTRREYIWKVFERQCEVALSNLERLHGAVGEKVHVTLVTGTDFGAQASAFISPQSYRDLYQPFHRTINDWVHRHTGWKTFLHSCGAVVELIQSGKGIVAAFHAPAILPYMSSTWYQEGSHKSSRRAKFVSSYQDRGKR